ncbi:MULTISPECIES: phage tail assembly protein [Paenibacillus]|uniref:phage tail assembly protein n=1 Tax=Paenibacillus TaxID=44249 RepID=UPI0022B93928|nr:phage tail assembly protein [Paenibacillus caseinilyticus]MCZ8520125.1 phage tail assembly protein [Paenibacillus caseinilyticus]
MNPLEKAAEQTAEEQVKEELQASVQTFTLSKPYLFDGESHTEIKLNFDALTGEDLIACERQLNVLYPGTTIPMKEISKQYLAVVAAKAAGVPVEFMQKLPAKDFSKVTIRVQNFLLV